MGERITIGVGWDRNIDPAGHVDAFKEVEFSLLAEEAGLDGVWLLDSPSNRRESFDPHVMLAYVAARSQRIALGTATYLLPLCHPVRLAKQLATLDILSRGRVILGVGVGGEFPKQFEAFGVPVGERGTRANEYIQIMRNLWTDPVASFHGSFHSFEGIIMEPRPVQKPIPVWVGGRPGGVEHTPNGQVRFKSRTGALQRAALLSDGWIPYYIGVDRYRDSVEHIRAIAREHGREPSQIAMGLSTSTTIADSYEEGLDKAIRNLRYGEAFTPEQVQRYDFVGTARDIVARMEQFVEAGCRNFICKLQSPTEEVPAHMGYLAKEVASHFR